MSLPTLLGVVRIGAAAVIAALLTLARDLDYAGTAALGLFCLGVATDIADGALARRQGIVSDLGAFLDPLADKLLVFSALIPFFGWSPVATVLIGTLAARDLAVLGLRASLHSHGIALPAFRLSKLKTAVLYGACALLLLGDATFAGLAVVLGMALLAAGTFLSVVSGLMYAVRWRDAHA
jgi:CDP-diacylglycerol--glycerol-3-phosphate 3-phosphatidyltransferase